MKPRGGLPEIVEPPYRTKLGRARLSKAVQAAYRDRIIVEHLPLVKELALRIHENLPTHIDLDDLVHAGILGLFDAVDRCPPERLATFSSYAKHRIKGAILDSLRQLDWASRDLRRVHKEFSEHTREQTAKRKGDSTQEEIPGERGADEHWWRQMMAEIQCVGSIALSGQSASSVNVRDFPVKAETHTDSIYARREQIELVARAIKALPERYRKVLISYYVNDMTMREIASLLGVHESRVCQIHRTALEKMAVFLKSAGVVKTAL